MGKLLLAFTVLMCFTALTLAQEVTLFIDGVEYQVPEGKKLALIPDHWNEADVYRESHRVEAITSLVATPAVVPEEDCLVISPATTCAEMRELMGNLGR